MKKIKVVWLCHFSNKEIQYYLQPYRKVREFSPWIPNTLKYLEHDNRLDIYVISPHEYITGIRRFILRGINYIFYNGHMPFIGRHWPHVFKWDYINDFYKNKLITRYLVDKIKPEIIHLHGAENAYYSSTILQFINKYPCILMPQGFVSHTTVKINKIIEKRIKYEKEIIKSVASSFYRTKEMLEELRAINPNMRLFKSIYPYKYTKNINKPKEYEYDLIYFAKVTKDKGIGDLLTAVDILKKKYNDISLCVIGKGSIKEYKALTKKLNLENNVYWKGFLPTQEDVHKLVIQAKISVLPTYHDVMPGGIVEAMFLGVPVVSYNIESNKEINEKGEVISLVETGNIEKLAEAIDELFTNPKLFKEREEKGKDRAVEMFFWGKERVIKSLLDGYYSTIEEFQNQ